jgi:fluoride exporter
MWKELFLLAVAGALGTLSRYGLSGAVQRLCGERFPWGTFAVNAVGCVLFGLVWMLAEERLVISGGTRFLVLTGFMGSFTTFSTYAFETSQLLQGSQWWLAVGNALGQLVVGVIFVFMGFALGRLF